MNNFADWLLKQMMEKGWSQSELARMSGLTRSTISYYLSPKSKSPDETALRKISKALKLPPETVFRAAGLLPPQSPETELINRIVHLTSELPEEDQADILEYAQMRHRRAEEREKNDIHRKSKKATAKPT
jgi:transcriptional regulator with XRE-family HTH domain